MFNTVAVTLQADSEFCVDNIWTISSVVFGSGVALLCLMLGPLLIGEYIAGFGISESSAGIILSVELFAFTLASLILFGFLHKNWRGIVAISLLLMVLGNALFLIVEGLWGILLSRFVAGFGSGALMAMTIQVIGLTRNPDRVYGLWTICQLSLGALGIITFATLLSYGGIKAVFLSWALLAAILFITVRYYPAGRPTDTESEHHQTETRRFIIGLLCLAGLFIYFCGQTGVWAYLEQIGASWSLDQDTVAQVLFMSLIAGIAGSGLATLIGNKLTRVIPLSVAMLFSALSILLLFKSSDALRFAIAACLFNFGWYLFLPYISAVVSIIDTNGKLLNGLAVTFPASLAAGPALAALFLGNSGSLMTCLIIGLVSIPLGLILIFPAIRFKLT